MTEQIFQQTLWYITVPSTIIFAILTIATFIGMDATDGIEADFEGDLGEESHSSVQLFSLRNLISFLMGLGWGSLMAYTELGQPQHFSILIGTVIGLFMIAINLLLIFFTSKLHAPNIVDLKTLIGKTGTVYLTVPPQSKDGKMNKLGSVSIVINGSLRQLLATTCDSKPLQSNSIVEVDSVLPNDVLVVTQATFKS